MKSFQTSPPRRRFASRIMWRLSAALAALSVCGWIAFFAGIHFHASKQALVVILTGVGLSMEGAVWSAAAALGVTVFEARKRIWRFLTGRRGEPA